MSIKILSECLISEEIADRKAFISCNGPRLAAFLAFWLVLYLKLRIEEKLLVDHFPEYPRYRKRSRMFFPWF